MPAPRQPFTCPACGEEVPANAKSCPDCGACEKSGWSGDAGSDGLNLPDDGEFNYDRFVEEEFGGERRKSWRERLWWVVAVVLLLALAWA